MLWTLRNLIDSTNETEKEIEGQWVPCRPVNVPWTWRIRHAWMVLKGEADAVTWPGGQ